MSASGDSFMPTGTLRLETGLDGQGEPTWRLELDGMSQTDAIGIMVIAVSRYVMASLANTRRIDDDEEPPESQAGWG